MTQSSVKFLYGTKEKRAEGFGILFFNYQKIFYIKKIP